MATKVVMPKLGATMEEGTIVKWLINVGDEIEEGDPLVEVLTDKITMEIEAEADGVLLKTLYDEDDVVNVYETIAYIGEEGEVIEEEEIPQDDSEPTNEVEESENHQSKQVSLSPSEKVRRTPAARKLAEDNELSLHDIEGTGPKGRIQKHDVETYLLQLEHEQKATPLAKKTALVNNVDLSNITGTGVNQKIVQDDVLRASAQEASIVNEQLEIERKPFAGMRKVIADRMVNSVTTAPHVTLTSEVDMTEIVELRKQLLPVIEKETGLRLSFNEIMIKAVANTLQNHKDINLSLQGDEIVYYPYVNIGFAVAVPNGLVVPVINNASEKGLAQITKDSKQLTGLAREGKLTADLMTGGTFTISNLGMYAVDAFNPIINQPESAILGIGRIVEKPVGVNGEIMLRSMMTLSLSFDHRIIDGAPAAAFLTELKDNLEHPYKLLV